jgi:hypothetical protein
MTVKVNKYLFFNEAPEHNHPCTKDIYQSNQPTKKANVFEPVSFSIQASVGRQTRIYKKSLKNLQDEKKREQSGKDWYISHAKRVRLWEMYAQLLELSHSIDEN